MLSESLTDKPLDKLNLLVDRKEDLENLSKLSHLYHGTLIGVAGLRGIGKTTVFNLFTPLKRKKILLRIMNRDSIDSIFADLCYALSKTLGEKYLKILEKDNLEFSPHVGLAPGLSLSKSRNKVPFLKIVEDLRNLLDQEKDIIIILDEIDKESKEEIIRVMDALKYAFEGSNTTVFVAVPPSVYKEYVESKSVPDKTHNLENIFSYMMELAPLKEKELKEMVALRAGDDFGLIEPGALDIVASFAQGNPRQMLAVLKEATLSAADKIKEKDVREVIKRYLSFFIKSMDFTHKELAVLSVFDSSREQFLSNIDKSKMFSSKTSAYMYLNRLEKKGAIKISEDNVSIDSRLKLSEEYGLLRFSN